MPREVEWSRPLQVWQRKLFQGGGFVALFMLGFGMGGIMVVTGAFGTVVDYPRVATW